MSSSKVDGEGARECLMHPDQPLSCNIWKRKKKVTSETTLLERHLLHSIMLCRGIPRCLCKAPVLNSQFSSGKLSTPSRLECNPTNNLFNNPSSGPEAGEEKLLIVIVHKIPNLVQGTQCLPNNQLIITRKSVAAPILAKGNIAVECSQATRNQNVAFFLYRYSSVPRRRRKKSCTFLTAPDRPPW